MRNVVVWASRRARPSIMGAVRESKVLKVIILKALRRLQLVFELKPGLNAKRRRLLDLIIRPAWLGIGFIRSVVADEKRYDNELIADLIPFEPRMTIEAC